MPSREATEGRRSLRAFAGTTLAVEILLVLAGTGYARSHDIPAAVAAPIVTAFLFQAVVFLTPLFPEALRAVEARFPPWLRAGLLAAVSLGPYAIYSWPLGLFDEVAFAKLAALVLAAAFLFRIAPPREQALSWQDLVMLALLVSPVISGLTPFFRQIYLSPGQGVPRLDILGKLMVAALGANAFLSLRPLPNVGFRLLPTKSDCITGFRYFLYYLPVGIPLALGLGAVSFSWPPWGEPMFWLQWAGKGVGIYLATALPEELCFRGILQNLLAGRLRNPWLAQVWAAAAFGAVHLSFRFYPNWKWVIVTFALGLFCGQAWRRGGSVTAAAITHVLIVLAWTLFFR